MAKKTSIFLSQCCDKILQGQVNNDHYSSASEVKHVNLSMLEKRAARLMVLKKALEDGEKSGSSLVFDLKDFLKAKHASFGKE